MQIFISNTKLVKEDVREALEGLLADELTIDEAEAQILEVFGLS